MGMRANRWGATVVLAAMWSTGARAQSTEANGSSGASAPTRQEVKFAQDKGPAVQDDLFAGTEKFAKGASDATEVNMDPDSLAMVDGSDAKRAHNMVLNVVRTYNYDKPGMYRMEDVEEFRRKLNTGDWHCSVHTRSLKTNKSTDICNKKRTDGLYESAIITVEPQQLTFIHTISKGWGGSSLNAPGMGMWMNGIGAELAEMGPALATLAPTMAALQPELDAEMKDAAAEMKGAAAELQLELPKIDARALGEQMPELQKQMKTPHLDIAPK